MDVTPLVPTGFQLINGYGDGGFTIAGIRHEGSVLVMPRATVAWPLALPAEADAQALLTALADEPRPMVLLLGCGKGMLPVPRPLRDALKGAGIVPEPMDTGAACRTFNVMLTEGRDVAAVLVAV
ncbi:Mth938-like domain-containing protein [Magnetospirillum sp. UT-4]|uniref:Mth938-like domain-containing protein n=1 Tax=Magnetospirillum sp. UT-4 TaxID=2681467 RepID=UPI001385E596|nr:Mth938-like domain-containing protein [Magnetospirillum sp. UT-4]CAA7615951.1 conserved hypothetical protein [Magnetospirillum sp. UT-4]